MHQPQAPKFPGHPTSDQLATNFKFPVPSQVEHFFDTRISLGTQESAILMITVLLWQKGYK